MKRTRFLIFLFELILIFQLAGAVHAQTDAARALIRDYLEIGNTPGMAVAVAKDGKALYQEAFGWSDLENKSPVHNETKFRMASVSKVVTAAAAARLYERGMIDIDAPIQNYVPDFPPQQMPVTIRLLAGHLAGVRHYKPEDFQYDSKHFNSVNEALPLFIKDPLIHAPGSTYSYSSYGYNLIAAALEKASGKTFEQVLQEEVFSPLEMKNACLDQVRSIIPGRTRFYAREANGLTNAGYQDPSSKWAAGGILASAGDLLQFGIAHLKDGYLNPSTRQLLFTSQKTSDGKETGVGFGWRIGTDWKGRTIYHHAGNMPGARSVIVLYPQLNAVAVVLTNLYGEPPLVERTAQMIAEPFLEPPAQSNESVIKPGTYQFTGEYGEKKPFAGTLRIIAAGNNGLAAELEGTNPFSETAATAKAPQKVKISKIFTEHHDTVLVIASAFGLTDWRLAPAEGGYTGNLDLGFLKATALFRPVAERTHE